MNWKERRHKRLRKRATRTLLAREMGFLRKGKWRRAFYYLHFFRERKPIHERT